MKIFHKLTAICAMLLCLIPLSLSAFADEPVAEEIGNVNMVTDYSTFAYVGTLFDKETSRQDIYVPSHVSLSSGSPVGSLYILFGETDTQFAITDLVTGESVQVTGEPYMHRFIDLVELFGRPLTNFRLDFNPVLICEIYVFTEGQTPGWVQKWEPPVDGKADILLFSTHDDDAQLFFAGLLPYYAGELGYNVQVVYMTDHRYEPYRFHELLDGLWAVGVHNYPVAGAFHDFNLQNDMYGTYDQYANYGTTFDDLMGFVVENIRRFKPLVSVGHDVMGEYGHGMHMVYTDLLIKSGDITGDPNQYPESAEKYGVWDVPKTYIHLYWDNQIVLNHLDDPLEHFGGLTAYEASRDLGFAAHKSQFRDFWWYYRDSNTAANVPLYNPCYYGLIRSTVGDDVERNDFFENITPRALQAEPQEPESVETDAVPAEEPAEETSAPLPTATAAPEPAPAEETAEAEAEPAGESTPMWFFVLRVAALVFVAVLLIVKASRRR